MTKQLGYPEPSEYHRARHGDDVILKRNPGMAESLPRLEYDPASGKFVQAGTGLKQFCGVGAKNIPRVLEVFGDAIRSIGEMPPTFQERRVTTLGRTWDIEAAKELGGPCVG